MVLCSDHVNDSGADTVRLETLFVGFHIPPVLIVFFLATVDGLFPIRYGQRAQAFTVQFRTSANCPPEQSKHLARIARIGVNESFEFIGGRPSLAKSVVVAQFFLMIPFGRSHGPPRTI
jgi:hypothetical protein